MFLFRILKRNEIFFHIQFYFIQFLPNMYHYLAVILMCKKPFCKSSFSLQITGGMMTYLVIFFRATFKTLGQFVIFKGATNYLKIKKKLKNLTIIHHFKKIQRSILNLPRHQHFHFFRTHFLSQKLRLPSIIS